MAVTRMRFLQNNVISTGTEFTSTSGSGTHPNLVDRKINTKWTTSGENSDANTATISWVAPSSTIVSSLLLQNHNFKDFRVVFNSVSTFTPNLSVTGNAFSNTYYKFASQSVNSIDIIIEDTIVADQEKTLAQIIVSNEKIEFDTNPEFNRYRPSFFKKGVEQELSDGGIVSIFLSSKFRADINLGFINSSTYDSLTKIYNEHKDFVFCPFPVDTFTSNWNGQAFAVNWTGDLIIDSLSDNTLNGYTGIINLREIPN